MSTQLRRRGALTRTAHTETMIDAPRDSVWRVVTDLPGYSRWNPVMTRVSGAVAIGERIDVRLRFLFPVRVRCKVDVHEPGTRLRWQGGPRGILRGYHYFECYAEGEARTRFVHGETFVGLLAPLIWPVAGRAIERRYAQINEALAGELGASATPAALA